MQLAALIIVREEGEVDHSRADAVVLFCRKKHMYIYICTHTYFFISFSSRSPAGINETRVIIVLGRERWTSGPLSTAQVDTAHCGGGDAYTRRQGRESFFRHASVPREIYFASTSPPRMPNDMEPRSIGHRRVELVSGHVHRRIVTFLCGILIREKKLFHFFLFLSSIQVIQEEYGRVYGNQA